MASNDLLEYILEIDSLTTSEFCEKFKVPKPKFTGEVESSVNKFLQIDAIKCRLDGEITTLALDYEGDIYENNLKKSTANVNSKKYLLEFTEITKSLKRVKYEITPMVNIPDIC